MGKKEEPFFHDPEALKMNPQVSLSLSWYRLSSITNESKRLWLEHSRHLSSVSRVVSVPGKELNGFAFCMCHVWLKLVPSLGTSLVVQQLRLQTPNAGGAWVQFLIRELDSACLN